MIHSQQKGFTIVELLIVIVVIGILAAIVIVAFNGIQNRAHDTAIKSDLAAIGKKLSIYAVDNNRYPSNVTELDTLQIKVSYSAYATTNTYNLPYCATSGATTVAIPAVSKSGKRFYYSTRTGTVQEYSISTSNDGMTSTTNSCADIEAGASRTFTAGFGNNTWRIWVGGTA